MSYESSDYTSEQIKRDKALINSAAAKFAGVSLRGAGVMLTAAAGYFAAGDNRAGFVATGAAAAGTLASGLRLGAERVAALARYRNYRGYDDKGLDDGNVPAYVPGEFRRAGRAAGIWCTGLAGATAEFARQVAQNGSDAEVKMIASTAVLAVIGIGGNVIAEKATNTDGGDHGPAYTGTQPWLYQLLGLAERPAAEAPTVPPQS